MMQLQLQLCEWLFDDQVFFRPYNGKVVRAVDIELSRGCIYSCSYLDDVTITEPSAITVSSSTTNVSCNGGTDGTALLTIGGGTPGYSENWFGMDPLALPAGTYSYEVTDLNSCGPVSGTVTITEPSRWEDSRIRKNVRSSGGADE